MTPRWWYIPPETWANGGAAKPIALAGAPEGAANPNKTTPADTIQVIGRSRTAQIPKQVNVDLGVMNIVVTNGKTIEFANDPTVTTGSKSLSLAASRETALVETGLGEMIDTGITTGTPVSAEGISRGKMSKEKPRRVAVSRQDNPPITALSGVKL